MARKAKQEKKKVAVVVGETTITLTLHPPTKARKSWYVFWNGLVTSKSTGQADFEQAVRSAKAMVENGGRRSTIDDAVLTDAEFEKVQFTHYSRTNDPAPEARSAKTQEECTDALNAFKEIAGLERIASATPDDCARFQRAAIQLPKNWRHKSRIDSDATEPISANTVRKWSRMLQAAFERVNLNAGKKCVRGVVNQQKLLTSNPWSHFTWIEGSERPIRQFDQNELLSLLDYLETTWASVPIASLATKAFLWSCCRKIEVAGLKWESYRQVGSEHHFEIVGKWGVERWFRISTSLYAELVAQKTDDPYVFAAYSEQIRSMHAENKGCLRKICAEYSPRNFGRWFYERVKEWSERQPNGSANVHHFRKTSLQFALDGESGSESQRVADDVRVSESVLLGYYARPDLRKASNRTYARLLASLPCEIARKYGYIEDERKRLERNLEAARIIGNFSVVAELAQKLAAAVEVDAEDVQIPEERPNPDESEPSEPAATRDGPVKSCET